jgi:hypothetical protein
VIDTTVDTDVEERRSPSLVWHADFHFSKFVFKFVFEQETIWFFFHVSKPSYL